MKFLDLPNQAFFTFTSDEMTYKKVGPGHAVPTSPQSDRVAEISPDSEVFWKSEPTPLYPAWMSDLVW